MFLKRVCLISIILAVTSAAPSRLFRRVPMWYLPCGQFEYEEVNSLEESEEEISTRLDRIKIQYRLTLDNYLEQNYGSLYKKIRIGVHDHQYIPNWVPGMADVNIVKKLNDSSPQTVSAGIPLTLLHVYFVCVPSREFSSPQQSWVYHLTIYTAVSRTLSTLLRHKL